MVKESCDFGSHRHGDIENIMVLISHVILEDQVIKGLCDFMGINIKVIYDPAKFGGNRHSGNGDIMFLICHMISEDYVINTSCDFMGGTSHYKSPPCQVWRSQALW